MKKALHRLSIALFSSLILVVGVSAQTSPQSPANGVTVEKPKRVVFRANKAQITEAQTKLKTVGIYSGDADGKMNPDFRTSVKTYQGSTGLRKSGSLNRATLEKMGIALTETQRSIPIPESSYVKAKSEGSTDDKSSPATSEKPKRGPIFRATKDQINEAQRKLKAEKMYAGDEIGKLDEATRSALKKYQEAKGIKVTGTLNRITLEKMGIELTDKQKADAAAADANK